MVKLDPCQHTCFVLLMKRAEKGRVSLPSLNHISSKLCAELLVDVVTRWSES